MNEERFTQMAEDIGYIKAKIDSLNCVDHTKRVAALESKVNYGGGFMACIMALVGYLK